MREGVATAVGAAVVRAGVAEAVGAAGVREGVAEAVGEGVGKGVAVRVAAAVGVREGVAVAVAVAVGVRDGVAVAVAVTVAGGVFDGVGVTVGVGVGEGMAATTRAGSNGAGGQAIDPSSRPPAASTTSLRSFKSNATICRWLAGPVTYVMRRPSGDHAGVRPASSTSVSGRDPSSATMAIDRADAKAMCAPSGDQAGAESSAGLFVRLIVTASAPPGASVP